VWRPSAATYGSPERFAALRRDKAPNFKAQYVVCGGATTKEKGKDKKDPPNAEVRVQDVYADTISHATNPDFEAALEVAAAAAERKTLTPAAASPPSSQSSVVWQSSSSSAPSYPAEIHQAIWATDILGKRCSVSSEMANLVRRCQDKAALYYDVAECTLGLDDGAPWDTLQKAIFGSRPTTKMKYQSDGVNVE
jgi:hypothetical protein